MIENFGQQFFGKLKLNERFDAGADEVGKDAERRRNQNRDIVLEWVGRSRRNGRGLRGDPIQALFNPLEIASGGMTLKAPQRLLGDLSGCRSRRSRLNMGRRINVQGEMTLPGQSGPQLLSAFGSGVSVPVHAEPMSSK